MTIGERIKQTRGTLSRKAFGDMLNVSLNTITRYEAGDRLPDSAFIELLCKSFNISPTWLILGDAKYSEKALEKTEAIVDNQAETPQQVTEVRENNPASESHFKELFEAYKKIVSLQEDNSRLEKEVAVLAEREKVLKGELARNMADKVTKKFLKELDLFEKQAIADAAELRTEEDDDDDVRAIGDCSHIMAGVTSKT